MEFKNLTERSTAVFLLFFAAAVSGRAAQAPTHPGLRSGGSQRPDPALSALLAAVKAQQAGRTTEAIADYQLALRLKPEFVPARFQLSQLYLQTGRTAEATHELEVITSDKAAIDPHLKTAAMLRLAALYQKAGKTPRAQAELRAVLAIEPRNPDALATMGSLAMQRGDTGAAISYFQAYARQVPGNARVHFDLGVLLARIRQLREAAREFEASAELPGALPAADRARAILDAGIIYQQLGKLAAAAAAYRRATTVDPRNVQAWMARGAGDEASGLSREALHDYQEVVRLRPGTVPALFNEGVLYLKMRQFAQASTAFSEVLRADPNNAAARTDLAFAYVSLPEGERQAHLARARELYLKAETQDPRNAGNYAGLGFLDEIDGKLKDAAAQYEKLARLRPGRADILDRLASTYARLAAVDKNYWSRAIAAARSSAAIHPEQTRGWLQLSDYQARAGQQQDAIATLRTYLKRSPGNVEASMTLARMLAQSPATAGEARTVFDAVLKAQPLNMEALMGRADVEKAADPASAARDLEAVLKNGPASAWFPAGTQLADIYRKLKQPASIARVYQTMISRASQEKPGRGPDVRSNIPFLRQMLASTYLESGSYQAAAQAYEAIYQANHSTTAALLSAAGAYELAKAPTLALQDYVKAMEGAPPSSRAIAGVLKLGRQQKGDEWTLELVKRLVLTHEQAPDLASVLEAIQRGAFDSASLPWLGDFYRSRHAAEPTSVAFAEGLAGVDSATGKWTEASEIYTKLIAAHPNDASLLAARGAIETAHGDTIQALADYQAAGKLSPTALEYQQALSSILSRIPGREKEEIAVLETILQLNPRSLIDARRLANLYSGPDRAQQRVALYRKLIARAPDSAEYHDALASELESTGDIAGARSEYLSAQRLEPQDNVARVGLARLEKSPAPGHTVGKSP